MSTRRSLSPCEVGFNRRRACRSAGLSGLAHLSLGLAALLALPGCALPDQRATAQTRQELPPPAGDRPGGAAPASDWPDVRAEELQLLQERRLRRQLAWIWKSGLPDSRLVVFYGNPFSAELGPIGAEPEPELLAHLRDQGAAYQALDPAHPVALGLDYVSPVAQRSAGADGTYRLRMPAESIEHFVRLALSNHVLFFFDLQVGRAPVAAEVDALWPWLQRPGVNLALDPEFDMTAGGLPGVQFGRMRAAEINPVVQRLGDLVRRTGGPPKIVVLHQFFAGMVPDRDQVRLDPDIELVSCADGVGSPGAKIVSYAGANQPPVQHPGIKLFYRSDHPLMSEQAVLGLSPQPLLVMYQ